MAKRSGRKSVAQTPAPPKERIFGSKKNPKGSAASKSSASKIQLSSSIVQTLKDKATKYNKTHKKDVSTSTLAAVMRRGMGAYSTSHRPTISGGAPNSRQAWGFARVNKFLLKKGGTKVKAAYVQDDDLMAKGGIIKSPNLAYHGTQSNEIDRPKANNGRYGYGFYLALEPDTAEGFGREGKDNGRRRLNFYKNANVFEFDLSKLKIKTFKNEDEFNIDLVKNYDGAYLHDEGEIVIYNVEKLNNGILIHSKDEPSLLKYKQGGLIAPNGKKSNLTPEQYKLVRTPQFKAWFGDWENDPENSSKLLDYRGEPLVVYHGSHKKFNSFDLEKVGSKVEREDLEGFYFSDDENVAELYTYHDEREKYLGKKYVRTFFLNIRKLLVIDLSNKLGDPAYWEDKYDKIIKKAKKDGYDGVLLKNIIDTLQGAKKGKEMFEYWANTIVVFDPKNIKLADARNTTFDPTNPDIRYAKGGATKNIYKYDKYTELQKTLYSEIWSSDNVFIFKYPEISTAIIYDTGSIGSENKNNEKNKLKEFYESVKYDLITQIVLENFGEDVAIQVVDDIVNQKLVRFDVEKEKEIEDYKNIISFDNANIHFLRKGDYKPKSSKNLAPNGKPSNLNDEQYELVRTKQFKSWFGDWEKDPESASQVVDENGEPLVVYRGDTSAAKKGFVFKTGFNRLKYVTKDRLPNQYFFYFIDKYHVANGYAVNGIEEHNSSIVYDEKKGKLWYPKVTPYFLNIRKPLDLTPRNPNFPTYKEYYNDVKGWGEDKDDVNWKYPMSYGYNLSFKLFDKLLTKTIGNYIIEDSGYWSNTEYLKNKVESRKQDGWDAQIWSYFVEYERNKDWSLILKDIIQTMENQGYDGVVFLEDTNYLDADDEDFENVKYDYNRWNLKPFVYSAMKPEQIKLADGSNTTFDANNPDIRYDEGGKTQNGVLRGGYEELTDIILSKKIEKFLNSVKPFKYYFVNPDMNTLVVGFDKHYSENSSDKVKKEAESSSDYFDADSIQSTLDPKTEDTKYIIKLKKIVEYKKGGEMKEMISLPDVYSSFEPLKRVLNMQGYDLTKSYKEGGEMKTNKIEEVIDKISNVDSDPIVEGVMGKGGMLSDDKRETYSKWKDLINMSKSELEKFYNSEEGKEAGISVGTAKKLGISRGRTSAKWIMKMKDTPVSKWTPEMWKWANKQISFVSRMRGNKGDLYDNKGRKTRKHTSLLIWGHNPEKYKEGGETKMVSLEGYYAKGGEAKTCEVIRNGVRQIDPKSIEKLTDCVMRLPQTKQFNTNEQGEYTPERKQLHKKIIYDIKKDLTCVERKEPIAILMGGSPASGKSTFLKKYRPYLLSEEILKVDADEVRSKLPEYKGWNATQTHLETKDIVNLLLSDRNIGIPCAFDLIYDGTMNSTKSYIPLISLLKSLGYKVFIVYIDKVDEDTIKQRALKRYQKSGRFVPLEVIDDFFNKGTSALENLKSMVDGYMIVDGSTSDYKIIDRGGLQLPKDRKYSNIGRPIEVTEEEVVREYKKGGETDFNPDAKKLKNMITHKSGSAGGMLVGNRHSEGGIKAMNKSTGQPLEMEGGEVVITRDAVSDDTKREFEGKMLTNREILSKINESGGGVAFAEGGDVHECGCTGKSYNYGGKTMTDFDIVMQMKSAYPKDFAKGKEEELSEHRGTFEKLRRKGLTANKAAELVVAEHLKKKPDYYKNYKEGGVIDILGKKIPSMPTFMELGDRVITPFKEQLSYFYPIKNAVTKNVEYRDGGHIRGRKISDLLAYKTYIYDNFDINFSDLPVKLQNALTLGKQKLVDDYLKE